MISLKISLRGFSIKVFALLAGSVNMRFLFLPIPWISKSLILVTNWKVSIPWRRRTFLAHCNHWPEQPSTQSEVNYVFILSIGDALLASSFSLADSICQILVTSWRSVFSFHLSTNSAMLILLAAHLHSSAIARNLGYFLIPLSRMNSSKFRLATPFRIFATSWEDYLSVDFLFLAQVARNHAVDFSSFGETAVRSPGGWFSLRATSWSLLSTYLYADR